MLPTLTYPVEQPYRLRWITEIFYAGSVVLIILLVVFNVALVGYDSVTVMISDPNITDYEQWWAPRSLPNALKFRTKPGECDEAKLPLNTPLRTNSSLPFFSYILQNGFNQHDSQLNSRDLRRETPYKANPLDTCRVQTMTLTMEPKILSFVVTTTILCDPTGDPPRARRFQTSFKRADSPRFRPDSVLEYTAYMASSNETDSDVYKLISRDGPPKDTYLNVLGVIDALASDLIRMMFMRKVTWFHVNSTTGQPPVPELGSMEWDSRFDDRAPTDESRLKSWKTYTDGIWYEGVYIHGISTTIVNMFVAIRDAIHLDVGYVTPTNIYANKSAFNDMIVVDNYRSRLASVMYEFFTDDVKSSTTCSWGWGCAPNFNTSWAQALTSTNDAVNNITLPIALPSPLLPSVIDMVYLCPQYRLKSWGSLIIDVFTGTFTMYVTLYGIFAWVASTLDRKRKGPQPWERFMSMRSPLPEYGRRAKSPTSRAPSYSSTLYTSEFEDDRKRLLDEDLDKKGL